MTTDKIKKITIISPVVFTAFAFLCKRKSIHIIVGRLSLDLCNYSSLKILGDVLVRTNLMSLSTSSPFDDFCFNMDKD